MLHFTILSLICYQPTLQLICSSSTPLKDYSTPTVSCQQSCPFNTQQVSGKCLRSDQYLIGDQVHVCQSTHVSADRQICCRIDQYIFTESSMQSPQCLKCNGRVHQKGSICCSSNEYMNYAIDTPSCTKIGTGQCQSTVAFSSKFKICCSSSSPLYSIQLKRCVASSMESQLNCSPQSPKMCCPAGQMLEYLDYKEEYSCVSLCNWKSIDTFYCGEQFCNGNLVGLASGPSYRDLYNNSQNNTQSNSRLLSLNSGQCCYGTSSIDNCLKTHLQCGKRFTNRGWSICCPPGTFYNIKSNTCTDKCNVNGSLILFEIICLTNSSTYLNLTANPPQLTTSQLCNGRSLHSQSPVCCPKGFYVDGASGCRYCSGTIHGTDLTQICCQQGSYFNQQSEQCQQCEQNGGGIIDKSGTLCCFKEQFVEYNIAGVASCKPSCAEQQIYQTEFCCLSLNNTSCRSNNFTPNQCNPEYYVDGACQACPSFCSNTDQCSLSSDLSFCTTQECQLNFVYFADLEECLSCDSSCNGCNSPFDESACTGCVQSYVMINGMCQKCNIECKTCQSTPNLCASCYQDGPKPFLNNGVCTQLCGSGAYLVSASSSQCNTCNFNCTECQGSANSQCLKCQPGAFLQATYVGSCTACSGQCNECLRNASSCVSCASGFKYYLNTKMCVSACASQEVVSSNVNLEVCLPCHPNCKTCKLAPQNCYSCTNSNEYIDKTMGIGLCQKCLEPCNLCSSKLNCSTCVDGYYLNSTSLKCLQCFSQCKTCHSGSQSSCLTCFGDSQLIGGKCVGCSNSCSKCDQAQNCIQCKSAFSLYKGSCLSTCPNGTYPLNMTNTNSSNPSMISTCTLCYSQCLTCRNDSENGCLTCQSELQLVSGRCVGCSSSCYECNASTQKCTKCNSGYYLYQATCRSSCPSGTYITTTTTNGTQCTACASSCLKCSSAALCLGCAALFPILHNGVCMASCPTGFQISSSGIGCQVITTNNTNSTNGTTSNLTASFVESQVFLFDHNRNDGGSIFGLLILYFKESSFKKVGSSKVISVAATIDQMTSIANTTKFFLLNLKSGFKTEIPTKVQNVDNSNNRALIDVGPFPPNALRQSDATLTSVDDIDEISQINSSYRQVSARPFSQFIVRENQEDSVSNVKILAIFFSIVFLILLLISKLKSHFLAQQANTLLLHFLNLAHVIFLFRFLTLNNNNGLQQFQDGFGWSALMFFPNFFSGLIPKEYMETTRQKSLVPDGNLVRNAGQVYSYQLIVIGMLAIASIISFSMYYMNLSASKKSKKGTQSQSQQQFIEMPQIRKIMRVAIMFFQLGFLVQLFFSFVQLIQPASIQPEYDGFHTGNVVLAYLTIFIIPLLIGGIFYHFYSTYNSDILEHYYTLREAAQFIQIYVQALIMCFSVGKPLIALFLIPVELVWLLYNYQLYRYGQGYSFGDYTKFWIVSSLTCFALLFLALTGSVPWQLILVVVSIVFGVLLVYGVYQIIGLYYWALFRGKAKQYSQKDF